MKKYLIILAFLVCGKPSAQNFEKFSEELKITPLVEGTLLLPKDVENPKLVILLGGSGPIDRDGNQMMSKSNSLKLVAEGLFNEGIASFRYDKRIVKMMKNGSVDESTMSFDQFVEDAVAVIEHLKDRGTFSSIYLCGHSQGSLVGMIAAKGRANGFISLAGAGQAIDAVIVDQLAKQAPGLKENARESFDDLRQNGVAENFSPGLSSIFRRSLQPFLISWMKYDPQQEIASLDMPVLIVNGDQDLQVQLSEARLLYQARPSATFEIINGMNHVLKEVGDDDIENSKSYNEPNRPLHPRLIETISKFVKAN
jgi:pimeloyl-ACP methyl ester carboxylesterase